MRRTAWEIYIEREKSRSKENQDKLKEQIKAYKKIAKLFHACATLTELQVIQMEKKLKD